jgi:hypothetical protein
MASFLVRAFKLTTTQTGTDHGFEDTTNNTHRANIEALANAQITLGCQTNPPQYCPQQPTTRAQMASFITRTLKTQQPQQT